MEVWIDEKRPDVMSTANVVFALVIHIVCFLGFFIFARLHFKQKETVIPIDLTVVVNENLDGNDDEPPPLDDPPPKPPEPPKVVTPPPPPKVDTKVDAVVKEKEKTKKPEKKPPEKKPEVKKDEPKKPEPPKKVEPKKPEKTKEELLKERMEQMVKSAKSVDRKVPDAPSGNGRTERQTRTPEEIAKLLGQGYKPGKTTQIATSTMQLCLSKIQMAINARWSQVNPRIGKEGYVLIAVRFNASGQMVNCRLSESCDDKVSDSAALTVVRSVGPIAGLDKEFLREFGKQDLVIRYKVVAR
jgi:TonB family protein